MCVWMVGRWCPWLSPVGEWQIRGGRSQWGWGKVRFLVNTSQWIPLHLPSPARQNVIHKYSKLKKEYINVEKYNLTLPEDRSCEEPLHKIWRRPSVGRLWIGVFSMSCLQNATGSWSPFHRDTAGWEGTCGQRMPAEKVQDSLKMAQSLFFKTH